MALKWADGNGGRKDVLSLPTASPNVKGGIKVGQNLYMTAESLNASPMGGVSFSGGLSFANGTLTFDPLAGLPVSGGLSFDNGTLTFDPLVGLPIGGGLSFNNGTLTFDPPTGLPLGDGLYYDNGTLKAAPVGDGLYYDNGTLTFDPLAGLPIGDGLYFDNGTLNAAPAAYWCNDMADLPINPQQGCLAIADNVPYFYGGESWTPFCQCNVFIGATSYADGEQGLVPKPVAGEHNKVLHGNGLWSPFLLDTVPSNLEGAMWLSVL